MNYNLEENVKEFVEFTLGGFTYKLKLPTTEEIEQLQKIKDDEERGKKMFDFVSSDNADAPEIEKTLKSKSMGVMRNFIKMIEAEMGA